MNTVHAEQKLNTKCYYMKSLLCLMTRYDRISLQPARRDMESDLANLCYPLSSQISL